MVTIEDLDKEIGFHGLWKARLKMAIDHRKMDTPPEIIRQDNQCALGKWLYGSSLTPEEKETNHYRTVKAMHAEFHKVAACVAELALRGKKAEANAMMSLAGEYTASSASLTEALLTWKKASGRKIS